MESVNYTVYSCRNYAYSQIEIQIDRPIWLKAFSKIDPKIFGQTGQTKIQIKSQIYQTIINRNLDEIS
jgi:hypothetical protein